MPQIASARKALKEYTTLYDQLGTSLRSGTTRDYFVSLTSQAQSVSSSLGSMAKRLTSSSDSILAKPIYGVKMSQILDSTDALKRFLERAMTVEPQGSLDHVDPQKAEQVIQQIEKVEDLAMSAMPPEEASDRIAEYYRSIADLQVVCGELADLSKVAVHNGNSKDLWSRIEGRWNTIKNAIVAIGGEIRGVVANAADDVYLALGELKDAATSALDKVAEKLDQLAHRFYELIISLIMRMFDFTRDISDEANKKGFTFKEMSLEFPTFDFQFQTVGTFSIPIPKSIMPKMTITYQGGGKASKIQTSHP